MGEYAAGQRVYDLELGLDASVYIVFCPQGSNGATEAPKVKLPRLKATSEHLVAYEYKWLKNSFITSTRDFMLHKIMEGYMLGRVFIYIH